MRGKNITVEELIKELQKYKGDQRVWIAKSSDARPYQRVVKVNAGRITMHDDVIIG